MKPESYICFATFFAFWGDRMWTFAVGIYMVKITPDSLQLAATFGFVLSLSAVIFSPMVGDWIDRNARLYAVRTLLLIQNSLVIVSAGTVMLYLYKVTDNLVVLEVFKALIIISGSLANLSGQGETIAIGRDWVVVVSRGNNDVLTTTNAMIRRIDLTVAILAPLLVGLLMSFIGDEAGLLMICSWNVISMFGEYFLLLKVHKMVPELAQKSVEDKVELVNGQNGTTESKFKKVSSFVSIVSRFKTILSGWMVYQRQTVFLAGCALAALFLTVIGFGHVTIGYAYLEGLSELYVSVFMAAGSLVGVFGTFMYPKIREKVGLLKTGVIGFIMQWSMLMLCVVSIWLPGSPSNMYPDAYVVESSIAMTTGNSTTTADEVPERDLTAITVLMAGIVMSRAGLWISDLTITQIQQENVPEEERGIVGGVQYAFNCLLDILRYGLTILLPAREQFGILILISVTSIGCSGIIYMIFLYRFSKRLNYSRLNDDGHSLNDEDAEKLPILKHRKDDVQEQPNYETMAL